MAKLNGVDISGWDKGINTAALTADFVIVKATEGVLGTVYNPSYRDMADAAAKSGKLIGFYHYANGGDPVAEANCFYKAISDYKGRAIACLDWEGQGNAKFETGVDVDWCKKFLDYISSKMNCIPLIYTSKGVCNEFDWSSVANEYPLWGAEYADEKVHTGYLSDPWQSSKKWGAWGTLPAIHQWGYVNPTPNNGGISSGLDGDLMYGDKDTWSKWCGNTGTSPAIKPASQITKKLVSVADIAALIHYDMVIDSRNGYSQSPRYGGDHPDGYKTLTIYGRNYTYPLGSYDCSSSTIIAWQLALKYTKYDGALNGATYTGDMKNAFVKSGLFKASLTAAKRGDLYLNEGVHVAMCQDGGNDGVFGYDCLSEFNRNELHRATGGKVGDQDGYESVLRGYYNDNWNTVLHYVGNIELYDASDTSEADDSENTSLEEGDDMVCFIDIDEDPTVHFYDGHELHALTNKDEMVAINKVYAAIHPGASIPHIKLGSKKAPYGARFFDAISRSAKFGTMNVFTKHKSLEDMIHNIVKDEVSKIDIPTINVDELSDEIVAKLSEKLV